MSLEYLLIFCICVIILLIVVFTIIMLKQQRKIIDLEKTNSVNEEHIKYLTHQITHKKQTEQDLINLAKGATLETAQQLSNKLLEDHKRENNQSREHNKEQLQTITKDVMDHVKHINQHLQQLHAWKNETTPQIDQLSRIFTEPLEGGKAGEIILENTLKSLGLREDIDYILQKGVGDDEGRQKRPDACLMLPSDCVIIIDSKSSKFFGSDDGQLLSSMHQHVKSLASKDYELIAQRMVQQYFPNHQCQQIFIFMFLPHDQALQQILKQDPSFLSIASEKKIYCGGSSHFFSLCSLAAQKIKYQQQLDNQGKIIEETSILLERLSVAFKHADKVYKAIERARDSFGDFAKSVDGRVFPSAKKLIKLGVAAPKTPLATITQDDSDIEQEE